MLIEGDKDIEKILQLLKEYTDRTISLHKAIDKRKKKKIVLIFTFLLSAFLLLFFSFFLTQYFIDAGYNYDYLLICFFGGIIAILGFFFVKFNVLDKYLNKSNYEDLRINFNQLKSLVIMLSQYNEHNGYILSDFNRFQIKLRLSESEEILHLVGYRYDFSNINQSSNFDQNFFTNTKTP